MSITVATLRDMLDEMIRDNPSCAGWEVRTIADQSLNDDDYTRTVGTPSECNVDEGNCLAWQGGEEQREEYEDAIGTYSPANAVIL